MMQLSIGSMIQTLRKQKGLTQEQLAQAVGISAPAVSKWESGGSYPDITLLMPLARALDTTVDGLLQFEAQLSDEAVMDLSRACAAALEADGIDAGLALCEKTLQQYPNSLFLKFRLAAVLQNYMGLAKDEQQAAALLHQGIAWMREATQIDRPDIRQAAVYALSAQYLLLEEYDNAQALLKQLPQLQTDPRPIQASIHLAKGELEQARHLQQLSLYQALTAANNAMTSLIGIERRAQRPDQAQNLCTLQRQFIETMGLPAALLAMNCLLQAELHAAQGDIDQALGELEGFAHAAQQSGDMTAFAKPPLFDTVELMQPMLSPQYLKQNWVQMLEQSPGMEPLRQTRQYKQIIEKLREK